LRPSQNFQGLCAAAITGMARRRPSATPRDTGKPSWNCCSGAWQVAHDTLWSRLKRVSWKKRRPSAAAAGSASTRLDSSAGGTGSSLRRSEASTPSSSADQLSRSAGGPKPLRTGTATRTASTSAHEIRFERRMALTRPWPGS
jgi:hypothetical protein